MRLAIAHNRLQGSRSLNSNRDPIAPSSDDECRYVAPLESRLTRTGEGRSSVVRPRTRNARSGAPGCRRTRRRGLVNDERESQPPDSASVEPAVDDGRDPHPIADAEGDERATLAGALQLVQRGGEEHGPGRAERVAQRDR